MEIGMQRMVALSIAIVLSHSSTSSTGEFFVRFWTDAQEICLGDDTLSVLTGRQSDWAGWEVCFFQKEEENGAWTDILYFNSQGRVIGPTTTMYRRPNSGGAFPVFFRSTPSDPIQDVFGLIRAGVNGPIRMNCVFINSIENPDFLLPPQWDLGREELWELRKELFSELTAEEIRKLGVNRVSPPILLKECGSFGGQP